MNKVTFLIALFSLSINLISSDYIKAVHDLFFFGTGSAKIEAQGGSGSVISDGVFSVTHNPSLFPRNEKFSASFSTYGPYSSYQDSKYIFAGTGLSIGNKISVSVVTSSFDLGENVEVLDDDSLLAALFIPSGSRHIVGINFKPGRSFSVGASGNFYELNSHDGNSEKTHTSFGLDVGIHNIVNVSKSSRARHRTCFGLTARNIYGKKISGSVLPNILTAGLEYSMIPELYNPFGGPIWPVIISFSGEFGYAINTEYSKVSGGLETFFFETLALRCGYYSMEIKNENIRKFTYGFGLDLPVYRYDSINLPLLLRFSYVNFPGVERSSAPASDYSNYSLTLSWMRRRD